MVLRDVLKKRSHKLPPRSLIGRTPRCDLHIPAAWVSGEHAAIRWSGRCWEVKDLGSRNGTRLDGRLLQGGTWHALEEGSVLIFGQDETTLRVVDTTPPVLFATSLRDGRVHLAEDGLLLLPGAEEPVAMVHREAGGGWVLDSGEGPRLLGGDEVISLGDQPFRIHLPQILQGTTEADVRPHLSELTLQFEVSSDEEYVRITALTDRGPLDLKSRAHHYLLLTLARLRRSDQQAGVDEASTGWVYIDELTRMLRIDFSKMNMDIFRARKQLAGAGVEGAVDLIERRPSTRQLRLGCRRLKISTI